jgi:SP family xylose:H+ symportor-like MFS transporter
MTANTCGRKPLMMIRALGTTFFIESLGMGTLIFMLIYVVCFAMRFGYLFVGF